MKPIKRQPLKSSDLNLAYAPPISHPNPIIVSTQGQTPNAVDLTFVISNPHSYSVFVDKIEIKIPLGEDSARCLSDDPTLPTPVYDTGRTWLITANASTVTISASDGEVLEIAEQSISFELNGITVNDVVGIVPITITEYITDGGKVVDDDTYTLTKLKADYPVTNFYAEPEIYYSNGNVAVLHWDCSEYGENCVYKVHSDSWNMGLFYTAADGQTGVQSPPLYQTTIFALDIYESNSEGNHTFIDTLYTTVAVVVPELYDVDVELSVSGIQRLIRLYWTAVNASHCEIEINGEVYISDAPNQTNPNGYLLFIGTNIANASSDTTVSVSIVACSADSVAKKRELMTSVQLKNSMQHTMTYATAQFKTGGVNADNNFYGIGITPNKQYALVTGLEPTTRSSGYAAWNFVINKVKLTDYSCTATRLTDAEQMFRISNAAVTNDTAYAIGNILKDNLERGVIGNLVALIKKINISDLNFSTTESTWNGQAFVALTKEDHPYLISARFPDEGSSTQKENGVLSFATTDLTAEPSFIPLQQNAPCFVVLTADGKRALIANRDSDSVSVVDVNNGALTLKTTLSVGAAPISIAVTADNTVALVANSDNNSLSVINLQTLTVEENKIAVGKAPCSIAVFNDQYAYVLNKGNGTITLVDIVNRAAIGGYIDIGVAPVALALTDTQVLAIQENSAILTNLPIA